MGGNISDRGTGPEIGRRRQRRAFAALLWAAVVATLLLALCGPRALLAQGETGAPGSNSNPLRVATKAVEPFVIFDTQYPHGFSVEVWEEVAERTGLAYEWQQYDNVEDVLAAVASGEADLAIGALSTTSDREAVLDFTHPYFESGLQIMTNARSGYSLETFWRQIFSRATMIVLGLGLLLAFVMANIILLTEQHEDPRYPRRYFPALWEALWYLLTIVANAEHPKNTNKDPIRRVTVFLFWIIGILFVAQFTATAASLLTVETLKSDIQSVQDLAGKTVVTVRGTTAAAYLAEHEIEFITVDRIQDAYPLLAKDEVDAILFDSAVLEFYKATQGGDRVALVEGGYRPQQYAVALPLGSELRKPINMAILEMVQDGTMERINNSWFGN